MKLPYTLFSTHFYFSLLLGCFLLTNCTSSIQEEASEPRIFPDGPDRAQLQNLYMVEDRSTHTYPFERLTQVRSQLARKRFTHQRQVGENDFQWEQITTQTPGRSRALYYQSSSGTVFTGSVSGGLWKNENFKENQAWTQVKGFEGNAVNCLAEDPINENVLYLGTGESYTAFINYRESTGLGSGIYRSSDGGDSWELLPSTVSFYYVNDLAVREEEGVSVLYAAVGSGAYETRTFVQEGLYRSINGGESWQQVLPLIEGENTSYQVADIEVDTQKGNIYLSTMRNSKNIGGSVMLVSQDGEDWSVLHDEFNTFWSEGGYYPGRSILKPAPANPDHLYYLFTIGQFNDLNQLRDYFTFLHQSLDGGQTWSQITIPRRAFNIPWHALSLVIDPNNEHKVLIGGLDLYVLNDASEGEEVIESDWIQLSYWYGNRVESLSDRYVHGDIHDLQFFNGNPNELLITTDGGIFYTEQLGLTDQINPENPVQPFPFFKRALNRLNTTQYYHAALHPDEGRMEAIGGTQDNGSIYRNWTGSSEEESMISGGDGGFNFFDRDDDIGISMVYGNRYYFHIQDTTYFYGRIINGLFVNPVVYDDQANLLYSNTATSSFGGLYAGLAGRYYDTLQIVNVNKYLGKNSLGLDTLTLAPLNAGLREAITALQLSATSTATDKDLFFGTENGKVYKVTGLPYAPSTSRIDNGQLPDGYISALDVGADPLNLLVTFSNFGIASVWHTTDGGATWTNLERDLPDMPVRWGRFNPGSDDQVILATEVGIWGLESISDPEAGWVDYNEGLPDLRVDMFDLRESDSKILAATHGQGLFIGTYTQESIVLSTEELASGVAIYPNPVSSTLRLSGNPQLSRLELFDLQGRKVKAVRGPNLNSLDVSELQRGLYILRGYDSENVLKLNQKLLKQ